MRAAEDHVESPHQDSQVAGMQRRCPVSGGCWKLDRLQRTKLCAATITSYFRLLCHFSCKGGAGSWNAPFSLNMLWSSRISKSITLHQVLWMEHTNLTFKWTKPFTMYPQCSQFKESPPQSVWVSITNILVKGVPSASISSWLFHLFVKVHWPTPTESGEVLPNFISKSLRTIWKKKTKKSFRFQISLQKKKKTTQSQASAFLA